VDLASLINNDITNVPSSGVVQIAEKSNLAFLPTRVLYVLFVSRFSDVEQDFGVLSLS
jgi:hypothetical protein